MITVHGGQVNISKDNSTINATQNNNGSNIDELMRLVSSIKAYMENTIPEDEKKIINDNIEAIQEQLKKDTLACVTYFEERGNDGKKEGFVEEKA